jgi:hypothetical protein
MNEICHEVIVFYEFRETNDDGRKVIDIVQETQHVNEQREYIAYVAQKGSGSSLPVIPSHNNLHWLSRRNRLAWAFRTEIRRNVW